MEAKFTEGPWEWQVGTPWIIDSNDHILCSVPSRFNCHLVAAAPDLYEALATILSTASRPDSSRDIDAPDEQDDKLSRAWAAGRRALKKARGET